MQGPRGLKPVRPVGDHLFGYRVVGPVEDQAHRPLIGVLKHKNDRAEEVRVYQLGSSHQQQASRRGHGRLSDKASPRRALDPERLTTPTNSPPASAV